VTKEKQIPGALPSLSPALLLCNRAPRPDKEAFVLKCCIGRAQSFTASVNIITLQYRFKLWLYMGAPLK